MKRVLVSIVAATMMMGMASAQEMSKKESKGQPYFRSSLTMVLMEDPNMDPEIANTVRSTYESAEAPKKFNDHNIDGFRYFTPAETASEEDLKLFEEVNPVQKESFGKAFGKGLLSLATKKEDGSGDVAAYLEEQKRITREFGALAYKYLVEQEMPYRVMEKWFPVMEGEHSMAMVQERCYNSLTPTEVERISSAVDHEAQILKISDELIKNTFIVVSRYRYMTANEFAEEIAKEADAVSGGLGFGGLVNSVTAMTQSKDKHSYVVAVRSFLFQLEWNEEAENNVAANLKNPDGFKNIPFKLKYIGQEKSQASVGKGGEQKEMSNDEIVAAATLRAFDKAIAKLEKKYEQFHVKTPLVTVDPEFTAEIGTYESVEGKDKYEILEQRINDKTGRVEYVRKGVLTVDPKKIWDNDPESEKYQPEGATVLTGKVKDVLPGSLIRRTKK